MARARSARFSRVVEEGRAVRTPHLAAWVARGEGRLAMAVRVRPRSAVVRNRARRRLREAFRLAGGPDAGVDVLVRAGAEVAELDFGVLKTEMETVLRQGSAS